MSHLALGYYHYHGRRDFLAAVEVFEEVGRELPNNSDVQLALAAIYRRLGLWDECVAAFERSVVLDPTNSFTIREFAHIQFALGNLDRAEELYDRAISVAPDIDYHWGVRVGFELWGRGSTSGARDVLERWPGDDPSRALDILWLERDWAGYLEAAEAAEPDSSSAGRAYPLMKIGWAKR